VLDSVALDELGGQETDERLSHRQANGLHSQISDGCFLKAQRCIEWNAGSFFDSLALPGTSVKRSSSASIEACFADHETCFESRS
jgi:hypothetical protein